MVNLIRGIRAENLLEVLRWVEVDGVLLLLRNTNDEFVIRLFNGPLDFAVASVAGGLVQAMQRNLVDASTVRLLTDTLNDGCNAVDAAFKEVGNDVAAKIQQGKDWTLAYLEKKDEQDIPVPGDDMVCGDGTVESEAPEARAESRPPARRRRSLSPTPEGGDARPRRCRGSAGCGRVCP